VGLFRDIERRICGGEAGQVRDEARARAAAQFGLDFELEQDDIAYQRLQLADLTRLSPF
jgi:hypothetical protein